MKRNRRHRTPLLVFVTSQGRQVLVPAGHKAPEERAVHEVTREWLLNSPDPDWSESVEPWWDLSHAAEVLARSAIDANR